ncbi:MAG: CCA tRNA nucleotidyltransferase [Clostridia bacterium]|nr:CCA tRNA nucleotidyltransferase [Clostridia bacterium]
MTKKESFNIRMPLHARLVTEKLEKAGFEAYAVGGAVRDSIRGFEPSDWDLASSALPEQVIGIFGESSTVPTGIAHGTVTVLSLGVPVEVTTFRSDGDYSDRRHPDKVKFGCSLGEDLQRRDFTVNAIAFSPERGIIDPLGGTKDISRRLIRAVGDPEKRFGEDALRIMRAFRFASVLGFDIEKDTLSTALKMCPTLENVSAERLSSELEKLLKGENAAKVLSLCPGLIRALFPELERTDGEHQNVCRLIGKTKSFEVRLALLAGAPAANARNLLKRLKFSNAVTDAVCAVIENGENLPEDRASRKLLFGAQRELFGVICAYHCLVTGEDPAPLEDLEKRLKESGECVSLAQLEVSGDEIKALGFSGRKIGETLGLLLKKVVSEELRNDKNELIGFLKSLGVS